MLFGQEGSDLILGGSGNDAIGGDGGDLADQGDDILDGGEGNDLVSGNGGSDQLFGGSGNDVLTGDGAEQYAGSDYLDGGAGDDTLLGMGSNDRLFGGDGDDLLVGNLGSDELHGGDGADRMLGDNGTADALGDGDTLYGDAGNDDMDGGVGDDVMDGGDGNDLVIGGAGSDQLQGGAGDDQLQGGDGDDALSAGDGNNSLFGQAGDDSLQAGSGNDYLNGGLGNDVMAGGDGDDVYHYKRGDGIDRISDTAGTDRLILEGITWQELVLGTGSLKLSFAGGELHLEDFDLDNPFAPGGIEHFQFADGSVMTRNQLITTLGMKPTGTPGPDVLTGTSLRDTISGLDGDDILSGRAGHDQLDGGAGNDLLMGDDGGDDLYGGAGDDMLLGGAGNDHLRGAEGDDILDGRTLGGHDYLDGGAGNDTFLFGRSRGFTVSESLVFMGGSDTIRIDSDVAPSDIWVLRGYASLSLLIIGGSPPRSYWNDYPIAVIAHWFDSETGEAVNEAGSVRQVVFADGTVWGVAELTALSRRVSEWNDYVVLSAGDDVLDEVGGPDNVYGGGGADTLHGGAGLDQIHGQLGDDRLYGGADYDLLYGGEGADYLDGGAGPDTLFGSAGDDILLGGLGNDRLEGGVGNETYVFGRDDGVDIVFDSDIPTGNADTVQLGVGITPADIFITRDARSLYINIIGGSDQLKLTDWYAGDAFKVERVQFADGTVLQGADLLAKVSALFDESDNYGTGTAGGDQMDGLGGNDEIHGLAGDDVLIGGNGHDLLMGDAGADMLDGGPGNDYLDGGIGNDTYTFGPGAGRNFVNDYDTNPGNFDTIRMAAGVAPWDVTVSRVGNYLHLSLNGGADLLGVYGWFYSDAEKVESVVFADGTIWGVTELKALVNAPANRAPVASPDFAEIYEDGLPAENGVPYVTGDLRANDVDPEGRGLEVSLTRLHSALGRFNVSGDGQYDYLLEANTSTAVQSLGIGDSLTDRFVYTVTDNDPRGAATATGEFILTIHGSNDAPVLGADRAAVQEDSVAAITGNVLANDYDVDAATTLAISSAGTFYGPYGTFTVGANGDWDYVSANSSSALQGLAAGQSVIHGFQFNVVDGDGAQVTGSLDVTVTGQNDAPTVATPLSDQVRSAKDSWKWILPTGSFTDVDNGDVLTYRAELADGTALPTWLNFDAFTQTFSGKAPKTTAGTFNIQVTATDIAGATAADIFALTINGSKGSKNGGGGGGGHGNEGVGNGPDAPPPGHDYNHNDGPGTGPGNPDGRQLHTKLTLIGSMLFDDLYF